MANKKMNLSGTGKEILDNFCNALELERPFGIKIALAKGIADANGPRTELEVDGKNKWTIPDNIIRDKEFLMFKHLIINEVQQPLDDDNIQKHMLLYIEFGLRKLQSEIENKSAIEDIRIAIL